MERKKMFFCLLITTCTCTFQVTKASKVLLMSGDLWSHVIPAVNIGNVLQLNYDHSVTYLLSQMFIDKVKSRTSFTGDFIVRVADNMGSAANANVQKLCQTKRSMFHTFNAMHFLGPLFEEARRNCDRLLSDNDLMKTLESRKFDLAVIDGTQPFYECYTFMANKVGISTFIIYSRSSNLVHLRIPFFPGLTALNHVIPNIDMGFVEQLENIFFSFLSLIREKKVLDNSFLVKHFGENHKITSEAIKAKTILYLLDQEPILDFPKPSIPYVKYVGGLGLTGISNSGNIPEDLQEFMDHSTKGVIIVSFGSIAKHLPSQRMTALISALEKVPSMRIVLNYHNHEVVNTSNIYVTSWLPQAELLAHQHTRIFVTHCGNSGQYEALYHGVPMIGLPLFGDQLGNCRRMQGRKFGLCLDFCTFSEQDFLNSVHVVLNGTFQQNIKHASEAFRDFPLLPSEKAAFWINHFYKHNNSQYYENFAYNVSWAKLIFGFEIPFVFSMAMILILILSYIFIRKCKH